MSLEPIEGKIIGSEAKLAVQVGEQGQHYRDQQGGVRFLAGTGRVQQWANVFLML